MVNKKILGLSTLLSTLATENAMPITKDNLDINKSEISVPSYKESNTINLIDLLEKDQIGFKKDINSFIYPNDPKELMAFYRKNISDNKTQPKQYRKMWKSFDKMLVNIIKLSDKYEKSEDKFSYRLDCPLDDEDKLEGIISIVLNAYLEKSIQDPNIFVPKLILTKETNNGFVIHYVLKPDLSIFRDKRAYAGNDKRDMYQILLIEFTLEGYSEQNEDRKKIISIQNPSDMKKEIKEFQKRIKMISKEKEQKDQKKFEDKELYSLDILENDIVSDKIIYDDNAEVKTEESPIEKLNIKKRISIRDWDILESLIEIKNNNKETLKDLLRANSEILKNGRKRNREIIKNIFDSKKTK